MEKEENISHNSKNGVDNYEFSDTLATFRQLDGVRKSKSITVSEISLKLGIQKSAYYRYCSEYSSQKASQPSTALTRKYADLFGYKMHIYLIKKVC
tara:strand:- start:473 stop:760 length:288 start_codon:yes stop_codon:yes gene_type:complete